MNIEDIVVKKINGAKVPFSEKKVRESLYNAGASEEVINQIIYDIQDDLDGQITTRKIYQKAFRLLKKSAPPAAARYNLKRSIMELGPSGYPFEYFIGEILKYQGYAVKVGEILQGNCLTHEVDVLAEKGNKRIMVECKYHNNPSKKSDVQVPMYIHSRFRDLVAYWKKESPEIENYECWIATNTRFTGDANKYGNCVGMKLISWDSPTVGSLKERIEISALYPVTCLTTLTKAEKKGLLKKNLVLVNSLIGQEEMMIHEMRVSYNRISKIMREVKSLVKKN